MAFATILAVVAGLTLTSASSVAHDLYANVFKKGTATESSEVKVARLAAFVIGGIAIVLAIPAQKLNIAFLVALAFAVAASANLPSSVYNLFWRRFNTRGATWSIYGGLVSCVVLVVFSPVVSGKGVDPDRQRAVPVPGRRRLPLVPAGEPGHRLDPARLPVRLAGHDHGEGPRGRGGVRRARGAVPDRRRLGEGGRSLDQPVRNLRSASITPAAGCQHTLVAGVLAH